MIVWQLAAQESGLRYISLNPASSVAEMRAVKSATDKPKSAAYRAPATARPGRPRRARIIRRGSKLVVSWRAPVPGFRHAVDFRLGDGREFAQIAPAGVRTVTAPGVLSGYGATVSIMSVSCVDSRPVSAIVRSADSASTL